MYHVLLHLQIYSLKLRLLLFYFIRYADTIKLTTLPFTAIALEIFLLSDFNLLAHSITPLYRLINSPVSALKTGLRISLESMISLYNFLASSEV